MTAPFQLTGCRLSGSRLLSGPPNTYDQLYALAGQVPAFDLRFDRGSIVDVINGIRPTYTRPSSTKLVWNGSQFVSVAADVPAFQVDPLTGRLGYLHEPSATNSIRDNSGAGAVVGTPGTLPVGWSVNSSGASPSVAGKGVEDGIPYVDIRVQGITTSTTLQFRLEESNNIAFAQSQLSTLSFFLKLVGGTWPNGAFGNALTLSFNIFDAGVAYVVDTGNAPLPSRQFGSWTRFAVNSQTAAANAVWGRPYFAIACANGQTVDFTLRIGLPQVGLGPVATSPSITSGSAVVRAADTMTITSAAFTAIYNQPSYTWFAEFAPQYTAGAGTTFNPHVMQVDTAAASTNNYAIRGAENSTGQAFQARNPTDGIVFDSVSSVGLMSAGQVRRVVFSISNATRVTVATGGSATTTANNRSANMAAHDRLLIGNGSGGAPPTQLNGVLYRLTGFRSAVDASRALAMVN